MGASRWAGNGVIEMSDSPNLEGKTVMVVDDDQVMRTLIRRMLARMKITTLIEANGGRQALQQLEHASPCDLIICDWNMPGMSGIELFDRVHVLKPDVPFLMLTGRADAESVIAAKRAGVPAYIVKPISPGELATKVSYLLTKNGG
jgi:two-component system chemotaxis response regulator CheY